MCLLISDLLVFRLAVVVVDKIKLFMTKREMTYVFDMTNTLMFFVGLVVAHD